MKAKDLKHSILQLAIQGKLVPQDPKDEPASKLLEKIRAAKQKLVKEGKIKKDKQESFIYKGDDNNYYEKIGKDIRNITDEIPFEIPDSWEWVRLGQLCALENGKKVENLSLPLLDAKFLRAQKTATLLSKGIKVEKDELIILVDGENSGEVFIAPEDGFLGSTFKKLFITPETYREYTLIILKFYQDLFRNSKKGAAIPHLDKHLFHDLLVGIPPFKEQKRIVSKIESLEPFIDDYNQTETELSKLNETFPDQIKKSILQYAIQGKLVPQDPSDEPASVLLEKIKAEKQKLIKAGKIKKDKQESYIYKRDNRHYEKIGDKEVDITDEIPFEIPDSWAWTRLENLVQVLSDGTHKTPQYVAKGVPFLSVQNISSGKFDFTKLKYITQEEHSKLIQRVKPTYNDILFCRIGTLGKAIKCTLDFEFSIFVSLGLIRLVNFSMNDYVILLFNSPLGDRWIQDNKVGGGTHTFKLNLVDIPRMLLPIPPLAEQDRIVAKVKKLLKLLPSND